MAVHFEIYVSDIEQAKAFYGGLFGWTFSQAPGLEAASYHLIDGNAFGDGVTGGLLKRPDAAHPAGSAVRGATVRFEVADCDERYAWALANGGSEALPPMDFPGFGRCAYVEDGQGNIVAMVTPAEAG